MQKVRLSSKEQQAVSGGFIYYAGQGLITRKHKFILADNNELLEEHGIDECKGFRYIKTFKNVNKDKALTDAEAFAIKEGVYIDPIIFPDNISYKIKNVKCADGTTMKVLFLYCPSTM